MGYRLAVFATILVTLVAILHAQPRPLPERYTAFAVSTGGQLSPGVASQVEINISRWSSQSETQRLTTTLKEKGPAALVTALREMQSVGTIRTPGNLAYDLRFAQQEDLGDGLQQIVLITDRPISVWEAANRPRSIDYPFTFIELRVNNRGEGEGKLALATRITASRTGRMVQLENYDTQPIHLNEVRRSAP